MSIASAIPDTAPKKFVFVLMPFEQNFADVYELGIKAACRDAGAYCERVDEQIFHDSILERVYNQIAKADLIVADMTGRNPNVFYEVGYAHALNKKTILLTQHANDIPFDLKHYPHIVNEGRISYVKPELERRVSWYLSQPTVDTFDLLGDLEYFIENIVFTDGVSIELRLERQLLTTPANELTVPTRFDYSGLSLYSFKLSVHNNFRKPVQLEKLRLAINHPVSAYYEISPVPESGCTVTGDKKFIAWQDIKPFEIMPGAWEVFPCRIYLKGREPDVFDCPIRIEFITNLGSTQMNLNLRICKTP